MPDANALIKRLQQDTPKKTRRKKEQALAEVEYHDNNSDLPKYERLRPVQARFSEDQLQELQAIAYKISNMRTRKGEMITKNTMVRIAVDFLLATWTPGVRGNNEEEIKAAFFARHQLPLQD